jgi:hypothetical protein
VSLLSHDAAVRAATPIEPLWAVTSATDQLAALIAALETARFCDRHGDPFADRSCVEHDIDGRTEVSHAAGVCRRLHADLVGARRSRGASRRVTRRVAELHASRARLAAARAGVDGHQVAAVFDDALAVIDTLVAALADSRRM